MSWSTKSAALIDQTLSSFGQQVSYIPKSTGLPVAINGIFANASMKVDLGHGAPISDVHPTLGIRLSDLATLPARGDTVVVGGVTYRIIDSDEDGEGATVLRLQK